MKIRFRYKPKVYFIHDEEHGCIKIGIAGDPLKRLRQLQTANPNRLVLLGTTPGGRSIEREIHDHFANWRILNEWFRVDDLLMTQVEGILQDGWPIP